MRRIDNIWFILFDCEHSKLQGENFLKFFFFSMSEELLRRMSKHRPEMMTWTIWDEMFLCFRVLQFVEAQNNPVCPFDATLSQTSDKNDWFTYQQDMALCLDVTMAWHESRGPSCPPAAWFEEHKSATVMDQDSTSIANHFEVRLANELKESVLFHSDDWSFIRIDFGWLRKRHGIGRGSYVVAISVLMDTDDASCSTKKQKL